jgi:hypothetical protein
MKRKGLISFSGGETSAFMAHWLLQNFSDEYELKTVFANTGEEMEETLEFVDKCDRAFGLNVTWVEAAVQEYGKGTRANVVNFDSASRKGEPFEAVIEKYGIPSQGFPHCSRELKANPIHAYGASIGWKDCVHFVGIRADEVDRMSPKASSQNLEYPLIDIGITKQDINRFWSHQDFRLPIQGFEGNCKSCWKKSKRKLLTIAQSNPERFDFAKRMEDKYQNVMPSGKSPDKYLLPARFYRGYLASEQILEEAALGLFTPATDDRLDSTSVIQPSFDFDTSLDVGGGCEESCEAF